MGNLTTTTLPENDILTALVQGTPEYLICDSLNIDLMTFIDYLVKNPDFANLVERARNMRAEKWVGNIIGIIQTPSGTPILHDKDDAAGAKLAIDTYKWLAKVDNPDRYGDRTKVETTQTNIFEVRGLSQQEAIAILRSDPFAPIDVEFTPIQPKQPIEIKEDDDDDML